MVKKSEVKRKVLAAVVGYFQRVGVAADRLANTLAGGDPDVALTARVVAGYRFVKEVIGKRFE